MADDNTTAGKSNIVPFLFGGLAGAGIIAILASESGNLSGSDIRNSAITAGKKISGAVKQGKDRYEKGKRAVADAIQKSKIAYDEQKDNMRDLARSVSGLSEKSKSIYEVQKRTLKDLSQSVSATVEKGKNLYTEMKGRIGDITQSFKTTIGGEEQKEGIIEPSGSRTAPIIAGTVTGVILVLLFYKKSGKDFGKNLKDRAIRTGRQLSDVFAETKARASDAIEAGKHRIQERRTEKRAA